MEIYTCACKKVYVIFHLYALRRRGMVAQETAARGRKALDPKTSNPQETAAPRPQSPRPSTANPRPQTLANVEVPRVDPPSHVGRIDDTLVVVLTLVLALALVLALDETDVKSSPIL